VSRPIWGWLADRVCPARVLLAIQGLVMCAAAIVAGRFAPDWTQSLVLAVCAVAGATASGFTGIAYAEWARIGGARRTEATGLGAGIMFTGVLLMPSAFSVAVAASGEYGGAYTLAGLLAAASGILLLAGAPRQAAAK
jgi:nitrate/nitrite transporter NarK